MTGWERLGIGGLSQGYLSGQLSPSVASDTGGSIRIPAALRGLCRQPGPSQ